MFEEKKDDILKGAEDFRTKQVETMGAAAKIDNKILSQKTDELKQAETQRQQFETQKQSLMYEQEKIRNDIKNIETELSAIPTRIDLTEQQKRVEEGRLRKENEKLKRELKELKNKVKEKSEVKVIRKVVKSEYQKVLSLFPAIFKLIENNKFPIINCDQLEDDEFKMIIKIFDTKLVGFYSNDIKKLEKLSLTSANIFSSIFSFGKIIKIDKNILTSENELLYSLSKEMLKRIKKEWKREKIEKILESYRRGF